MSSTTQAVGIVGTLAVVYAAAAIIQLAIAVYRSTNHDESHDWSDE